ncbi:hypothetical protein [Actinopolyspora mortivallis]|uniref:hypothetical protein n=1 Tax=Actinopolyspora mortivallis TaxID=33906 RepID=UPI0012EDEE59|nr:hypothetical protein [Actinopolyspora mortivallis]
MTWDSVKGAAKYEVRRDGKLLKTTTETTFIDSEVEQGTQNHYVVQALTPETTPLKDRLQAPGVVAQNTVPETPAFGIPQEKSNRGPDGKPLPPPAKNPQVEDGRTVVMGGVVRIPAGESPQQARTVLDRRDRAMTQALSSTVRHQAFIAPPGTSVSVRDRRRLLQR